ncbi:DUF4326 domain-containing protein [Vreelandella rituensis]|uniref:DUF4326 domain-containing protein n=1 Tax=Vreelandella rituensis TaxID=2282306 RepID=A0A368UBB2_9GAMM|nr:DUF4326 domain-containing protein [Halomonas rituensis]RCV93907.1 DUF4326 domain-containing protein [Halomonas rituensis]
MSATHAINCKHQKADVYIGRGSRFGNPFPITASRSRSASLAAFREWVAHQPELLRLVRQTLPGKSLGCFCAPQPCHGDILAEIADGAWDDRIPAEPVLVFGANEAGSHGRGAAAHARRAHGAETGVGRGLTGTSYALPTKDAKLAPLSLDAILTEIDTFKAFAAAHPHMTFQMTRVGCGLAGHAANEATLRDATLDAPANVLLPGCWEVHRSPGFARIVVAGSRTFTDYAHLAAKLDILLTNLLSRGVTVEIVSGGAKGADTLGERYAVERGLPFRRLPAEWERFDKAAGFIRNQQMSWYGTHLVAFWNGQSPGTKAMIDLARNDTLATRISQVA